MKIMISACLMGVSCKYSGGNNLSDEIVEYIKEHEIYQVCPEVMGGLPVPRDPSEIKDGKVISCKGKDVTDNFLSGAKKALIIAEENDIDLVILKSGSPSCGVKEIYDGNFCGRKIQGMGIFAKMMNDRGYRLIDSDELIGELRNKNTKQK